jgi:hypothetical protein
MALDMVLYQHFVCSIAAILSQQRDLQLQTPMYASQIAFNVLKADLWDSLVIDRAVLPPLEQKIPPNIVLVALLDPFSRIAELVANIDVLTGADPRKYTEILLDSMSGGILSGSGELDETDVVVVAPVDESLYQTLGKGSLQGFGQNTATEDTTDVALHVVDDLVIAEKLVQTGLHFGLETAVDVDGAKPFEGQHEDQHEVIVGDGVFPPVCSTIGWDDRRQLDGVVDRVGDKCIVGCRFEMVGSRGQVNTLVEEWFGGLARAKFLLDGKLVSFEELDFVLGKTVESSGFIGGHWGTVLLDRPVGVGSHGLMQLKYLFGIKGKEQVLVGRRWEGSEYVGVEKQEHIYRGGFGKRCHLHSLVGVAERSFTAVRVNAIKIFCDQAPV